MELTTLEIAQRCLKTERTVQRWLSTGKLKAIHLLGNRYEVAEDDLQPFLPHEVVESISLRLEALEARVAALEAMLQSATRTPRAAQIAPTSISTTLPEGLIDIDTLIKRHGLTRQRKTIVRHMESFLQRGDWIVNGHSRKLALDAAGQAEFIKEFGTRQTI